MSDLFGEAGCGADDQVRACESGETIRKERSKKWRPCPFRKETCRLNPSGVDLSSGSHFFLTLQIFCFPCIIHYFTLSDVPRSAKCPICGETIQEFLLKSVRWWDEESAGQAGVDGKLVTEQTLASSGEVVKASKVEMDSETVFAAGDLEGLEEQPSRPSGNRVKMRLVQRPQITTFALPRSPTWPSEVVPLNQAPWHFIPDVLSFSKFMLATSSYMISQLEREVAELERERVNLRGDELGLSFVDVAMSKVKEQIEKARTELDTPVFRRMEREAREGVAEVQEGWKRRVEQAEQRERERQARQQDEQETQLVDRVDALVVESATSISPATATAPTTALSANAPSFVMSSGTGEVSSTPTKSTRNKRPPAHNNNPNNYFAADDPAYFYYQADNGANVYLSPLDIKILLGHYKSYTAFPDTILVKPEGADEGSMNEDLRRRCKYLAHLQLGTNVVFVEADLEETLGKGAVQAFEAPLKRRRDRKREKTRKEDRAKVKWEAQERERLPFGVPHAASSSSSSGPSKVATTMGAIDPGLMLDEDFLNALERSNDHPEGLAVSPGTASLIAHMSGRNGPSPSGMSTGSSTAAQGQGQGIWGSPTNGTNMSFASALHTPGGPRPAARRRDPEVDDEMARAWLEFEERAAASRAIHQVEGQDGEGGGLAGEQGVSATGGGGASGKQGGKKGRKKVVLSMGGGGRRG